jgi:hypothetical protein
VRRFPAARVRESDGPVFQKVLQLNDWCSLSNVEVLVDSEMVFWTQRIAESSAGGLVLDID